jgi:hypothetical protein
MKSKIVPNCFYLHFIFISSILLFIFFIQESKSQDAREVEFAPDTTRFVNLFENSVGVRYSNISGFGLTMTRRFFEDYTIRLSGMLQYNELIKWDDMTKTREIQNQKDILYDFGIELQRDIYTTNVTKVYAFLGGYLSDDKNKDTGNELFEKTLAAGVGFGFQWYVGKHFAFDFTIGYKFDNIDTEDNGKPSVERKTGVGVGIGAQYIF